MAVNMEQFFNDITSHKNQLRGMSEDKLSRFLTFLAKKEQRNWTNEDRSDFTEASKQYKELTHKQWRLTN